MELLAVLVSILGSNGVLLFLVKRYFEKRDQKDQREREARAQRDEEWDNIRMKMDACLETLRLLSYSRMSEETEKLLLQGYATPSERRILNEMYQNYKAHGWNGDMDARLEQVYALGSEAPE